MRDAGGARPPGRPRWRSAPVLAWIAVALASPALAVGAETLPLPAWKRSAPSSLPDGVCQQLDVERVGEGLLEVRFTPGPGPGADGPDVATSGAALLLSARDPERPSLVLYDRSGPYARASRVAPPLRWMRRGSLFCVASGGTPRLCGRSAGEPTELAQIAFGPGWRTRLTGCAGFSPIAMPRGPALLWAGAALVGLAGAGAASRRARDLAALVPLAIVAAGAVSVRLDAAWSPGPSWLAAGAAVAAHALLAPGRRRSARLARAALALWIGLDLLRLPHPVAAVEVVDPVAPPLWWDAAFWHPRAAHQSLEFRGLPVSALDPDRETWLVLGGSVAFGEGVEAGETFTAVAEETLRREGRAVDLRNAGAQGWNLFQLDRFLVDAGDALPVDGLVLVSILNNATLPIPGPPDRRCERSLLAAWACNARRSVLWFAWPKILWPKPNNPERHREILGRLIERETALGRRIVLLDEPSAAQIHGGLFRLWNADRHRAIAREVGGRFGLALHPAADALAALPASAAFLDGIHPTAEGHRILGDELAAILRGIGPRSAAPGAPGEARPIGAASPGADLPDPTPAPRPTGATR